MASGGATTHSKASWVGRRLLGALVLLVPAAGLLGCEPSPQAQARSGTYVATTLTADNGEAYRFTDHGTGFSASAPRSNAHGNLRVAVVKDGTPSSVDQQACVTWNGPTTDTNVQPGVVLRSRTEAGRTRAIMVTDNVIYRWRAGYHVHLVDSQADHTLTEVGTYTVPAFGGSAPLPWRICARAVGATVTVKAWSIVATPTEPAWGDAQFGYSIQVPAAWVYGGRPGAYVAHLQAGEATSFSDLQAGGIQGAGGRLDGDTSTRGT